MNRCRCYVCAGAGRWLSPSGGSKVGGPPSDSVGRFVQSGRLGGRSPCGPLSSACPVVTQQQSGQQLPGHTGFHTQARAFRKWQEQSYEIFIQTGAVVTSCDVKIKCFILMRSSMKLSTPKPSLVVDVLKILRKQAIQIRIRAGDERPDLLLGVAGQWS